MNIQRFLEVEGKEIEEGTEFSSPTVQIFAPKKWQKTDRRCK